MSELEGSGHQAMMGHVTSFENVTSTLPTTCDSCAGASRFDGNVAVCDDTNMIHRFSQKYKLIEGEKYFAIYPDGSTYSGILLSRNDPRLGNLKLVFQQTPMDVEECPPQQQPVNHCLDSMAPAKSDDDANSTSVLTVTAKSPVPVSFTSMITSTSAACPSFPMTPSMTFPSSTASLPSPTTECAVASVSILNKANLRYHPYQRKRSASWTSSRPVGGPPIELIVRKLSAQFTTEFSSMMSDNIDPSVSQTSPSCLSTLFSTAPTCFSTSSPLQATATGMSPSRTEAERFESASILPLDIAVDAQRSPVFRQQSPTSSLQAPMTSLLLHSSSLSHPSSSFSSQHSLLSQPSSMTLSFPQSPTLNRSLEMTVTPSLALPSVPQSSVSMSGSASPLLLSSPEQHQNEVALMHMGTHEMTPPERNVLETVPLDPLAPSLTLSSSSVLELFSSPPNPLGTPMYMETDETVPSPAVSSVILNEPETVNDSETNVLEVMPQCPSEPPPTSSLVVELFTSSEILPETSLLTQLSPILATESMAAKTPEPMDMSETTSLPTSLHRSPSSSPKPTTSLSSTLFVNMLQSEATVDDEKMDVSETEASLSLPVSTSSHTTLTVPSTSSSSTEVVSISQSLQSFQTSLKKLALEVLNKSSSVASRPASPQSTAASLLPGLSPLNATLEQSSEPATLPTSSVSGEQEITSDPLQKEEVKSVQKKTEDVVQILSSDDEDDSKSSGKRQKTLSMDTTSNKNSKATTTDMKNNNIIPSNNDSPINNDGVSNSVTTSNGSCTDDSTTTRIDQSTVLVAVHLRQTLFGTNRNPTFKQYLVFIDRLLLDSGGSESVTIPFTEVISMYLHHGLSGPVFFLLLSEKFSVKLQRLLSICPTKFNPESSDLGSRYVTLIPSKRNALSPQLCDRNHVDSRLSLVKSYLEARFNHQVHLEMISGDRTSEILQAALIIPKKEPEKQMAHTASCPDLRPNTQITPPPSTPCGLVLTTEALDISQNQTPSNSEGTALAFTNGSSGNVGILAINGNGIGTAGNVVTPKGAFILVTRNIRQLLQPVGNKGGSSPTVFRFANLPRTEPVAAQVPSRTPFNESIVTLFTYPPSPGPGRMSITNEDFYCLNDGEFLNDAIIDFYLKYILLEKLDAETCSSVHVFSSFFYGKLSDKVPEESAQNSDPTTQQIRHSRVKTWTRHVDIFSKDFLVVPINENAHWFLAIICFPGLSGPIIEQLPTEDKDDANDLEKPKSFPKVRLRQPCILIFDSLGLANHFLVIKTLREYLQVEWDTRKLSTEGQREFSEQTVPGSSPRCPLQTNTSDCGIYLLQYVESFFQNPIVDFAMPIQNTANWFPQELVRGKRKMLQNLIIQLKEKLSQSSSASLALTAAGSDQAT